MVVLDELRSARQEGYDVVQDTLAWLDTDEYNNDECADFLSDICHDFEITETDVDLARLLLSRGVDANYCEEGDGWTLLHAAVSFSRNEYGRKLTTALIAAGADVNARAHADNSSLTPLGILLDSNACYTSRLPHCLESATLLLRAGASLDACYDDDSAEDFVEALLPVPRSQNGVASDPNFLALKTLFANVRRAGSYKLWTRENVKALLCLRSLIARGRAREKRRLRAKTPREIALLLAPAFPNELFWKVMTYWNPRV